MGEWEDELRMKPEIPVWWLSMKYCQVCRQRDSLQQLVLKTNTPCISYLATFFIFLWNFLTVSRLFLFLSCIASFEMLPWMCIFRGHLLVINTYCKLELMWMMFNCIRHSVFQEYIKNIVGADSSSRFYTYSMQIFPDKMVSDDNSTHLFSLTIVWFSHMEHRDTLAISTNQQIIITE